MKLWEDLQITAKYLQTANNLILRTEISPTRPFPFQTESRILVQEQESVYLVMDLFVCLHPIVFVPPSSPLS